MAKKKIKRTVKKVSKNNKKSKKTTPKKNIKKIASKKTTSTKKVAIKTKLSISPVILCEGDTAPDFNVKNQNGELISLASLNGKNVVLYFYPKDLTPGCTIEACDFRDSLNRLKSMNVEVFGVSMDDEKLHKKFIDKHNLNFDLLSDSDGKLCYDYGVLKEKNNYGKKYVGIVRSTFIIKDGKIVKTYPQVKVEGHVQQIINDINTL